MGFQTSASHCILPSPQSWHTSSPDFYRTGHGGVSLFLSSVPLGGLNAVNHFPISRSHLCVPYVLMHQALLTINGIRKSYKVELTLIGSSQFVRPGQSYFHDEDQIVMKNTRCVCDWSEINITSSLSFDLFTVVSVQPTWSCVAEGDVQSQRERAQSEGNSGTNRKCNYCLSGSSIPQQFGQFHSNFRESTGHK